jgi:hypothetical protein
MVLIDKQTKMSFTIEVRGKNAERMYDEWRIDEDEELLEDALFYSDHDRVRYLETMEKYIHGMRRGSKRMPKMKCTPSQQTEYKLKQEFKRQRSEQKKTEDAFIANKRNERYTVVKDQHENQDNEDCDDVLIKDAYFERMEREMCEWDEYLAVFATFRKG